MISIMYNDNEIKLNVNNRVSFVAVEEIIETIADGVFVDGKYVPSRFDYYFYACILSEYTDFDIEQYSTDDIYNMIYECDLEQILISVLGYKRLMHINYMAHKLIESRLNEHPLKKLVDHFTSTMNNGSDIINRLVSDEEFKSTLTKYVADDNAKNVIKMFDKAVQAKLDK